MPDVALATEDELSEVIGHKLVEGAGSGLTVSLPLRRGGFGYLKSRMRNFCELARQMPVVLITDLDAAPCATALIADWSRNDAIPEQLIFRVAIRQIESWLLADRESMANFLKIGVSRVPVDPDNLPNAKQCLLQLARQAPRRVREELLAVKGATASQGLGYNALLSNFVQSSWNPVKAATRSDSLRRASLRLAELAADG